MKPENIHTVRHWFEVLQTTKRSQTAVMKLGPGQASGERPEAHERSDQILLVVEGELKAEVGGQGFKMKKGDVIIIPPRAKGAKPWQWQAAPKDGFHVLRHTYASLVLEAGESVVTLARWLGHSSPTITLDHYAHFMPEAGKKGRRAIDSLLGEREEEGPGANSPDSPQHPS